MDKKRRDFIKKAVYKAPILVTLGSLAKPETVAGGDLRSDLPPPPPAGSQTTSWENSIDDWNKR